jgi:hypothetical protein
MTALSLLERLQQAANKSSIPAKMEETFPLLILIEMIETGSSQLKRHDPEMYNVALYLIKWLEPIGKDTSFNERKLSKFEENHLTQAIAYWTEIPESVIIDTWKSPKGRQ